MELQREFFLGWRLVLFVCWKSTHLSVVWLLHVIKNEVKIRVQIKLKEWKNVELVSHNEDLKNTPTCGTILMEN